MGGDRCAGWEGGYLHPRYIWGAATLGYGPCQSALVVFLLSLLGDLASEHLVEGVACMKAWRGEEEYC